MLPDTMIGIGGVYKVAIDKDDSKWVVTDRAVGRFEGSAWTVYTLGGIPAIAVDNSGAKWFGSCVECFPFRWTQPGRSTIAGHPRLPVLAALIPTLRE